MIRRPDMLLIGATGRNAGKTDFACALIERYSKSDSVFAAKITTINEQSGGCARGGLGCGVCGSLEGNFYITEETAGSDVKGVSTQSQDDINNCSRPERSGRLPRSTTSATEMHLDPGKLPKDTHRMVKAGAKKVYWLRVLRESLEEGVRELLERIPQPTCLICESNSARLVVEPGLFLIARPNDDTNVKASCQAVMQYADGIVTRNGERWSPDLEDCAFVKGRWFIRPQAAAIILAGGASARMGQNKALMPIDGKPMIARIAGQLRRIFPKVIVGGGSEDQYGFLGLDVISDREAGKGPLMGIASCLRHSPYELNFVTACDVPEMNIAFILDLIKAADGYDIVMPVSANGRHEPLFAVYRKNIAAHAETILAKGGRKIIDLLDMTRVKFVNMPDADWYRNVNTMSDYEKLNGEIKKKE